MTVSSVVALRSGTRLPVSQFFRVVRNRRNNLFALSVAQELARLAKINAGFDDRVRDRKETLCSEHVTFLDCHRAAAL
jgi:hypothetical protein